MISLPFRVADDSSLKQSLRSLQLTSSKFYNTEAEVLAQLQSFLTMAATSPVDVLVKQLKTKYIFQVSGVLE